MRRFVSMALLGLALATLAQSRGTFTLPNGHWWMGLNRDLRDNFAIGWSDCDGFLAHQDLPAMARFDLEDAITAYYRQYPRQLNLSVTSVIGNLEALWRRNRIHSFGRDENDYDGEMWRQAEAPGRDAMIRGFLSCQVSAKVAPSITVPVATVVARVSTFYGIDPNNDGIIDAVRAEVKLRQVILRAERGPLPPAPGRSFTSQQPHGVRRGGTVGWANPASSAAPTSAMTARHS